MMSGEFNILQVYKSRLSHDDFLRIANYMQENFGIKLSEQKFLLVQNRLYKRLIANRIADFETYVKFLFSREGKNELDELPSFLTTNKTEFFREREHFYYLKEFVLQKKNKNKFLIWSAACATGEEPYSIAFTLESLGVDYIIYASDISERVLNIAKEGIYSYDNIKNIDEDIRKRYFKEYDTEKKLYQIIPKIRNKIRFFRVNLYADAYKQIPKEMDFIFLRNVLIYFNSDVQRKVLSTVLRYLRTSGYLFLGHAEVVFNFKLPLYKVAPSIYQFNVNKKSLL